MKVGDLFIALGFQVDDKKLKDFNDNIKSGTQALGAMSATAAGAVYAVNRFTASSVDSSVKLNNLTVQTGTAADEVQRFYNVAGRKNTLVTLDETVDMFTKLSDTIAQAKLGEGPIGAAGMLGLDNIGSMTPLQVLMQLRKNYEANKAAWDKDNGRVVQQKMSELGVPTSMFQAITASQEEFNKLWDNPILNGDARDKLLQLAEATKEVNFQWELFKGNLSANFSPQIIEFLTNVNAVLKETADLTDKAQGKMGTIQKKTGLNNNQMRTVGNAAAVETGLGLMAIPSPFFATQGLGGAILVGTGINDAGKYLRGKPSTTGDVIKNVRGGHGVLGEELMKTQQEQEEDRKRILNGEPMAPKGFGRIGQQSSNEGNTPTIGTMNIYSTADAKTVAQEVIERGNLRTFREVEYSLGFNASGMNA